jgi:hypothetical protein
VGGRGPRRPAEHRGARRLEPSYGALLKQVDEIGPSAPRLSRRYTAARRRRRAGGARAGERRCHVPGVPPHKGRRAAVPVRSGPGRRHPCAAPRLPRGRRGARAGDGGHVALEAARGLGVSGPAPRALPPERPAGDRLRVPARRHQGGDPEEAQRRQGPCQGGVYQQGVAAPSDRLRAVEGHVRILEPASATGTELRLIRGVGQLEQRYMEARCPGLFSSLLDLYDEYELEGWFAQSMRQMEAALQRVVFGSYDDDEGWSARRRREWEANDLQRRRLRVLDIPSPWVHEGFIVQPSESTGFLHLPEHPLAPPPEPVVAAWGKNAGRRHRNRPRNDYLQKKRHGAGAIHSPSSRYKWKHP